MTDAPDLQRFVAAQQRVYDDVLAELRSGRKRSHWMWFVFPQLRGLGHSSTAQHYGIASRAEARGYLAHPVLGARLRECARIVAGLEATTAREVFGQPDDLKLKSSMTLFALAAEPGAAGDFTAVLDVFYGGERDETTARMWRGLA